MSTPYVRDVGGIFDYDGIQLWVGVDYDTVTIGLKDQPRWRLDARQSEDLVRLLVAACWQAAAQAQELNET